MEAQEVVLRFARERETKNTVRFEELVGDGERVIGTLYVTKAAVAQLGQPDHLDVAVTAAAA